jgi:hypothetical protein
MSWLVTAKQYIPAVIGEEFGGGYFAGYISHTADGNPTHALIVAPRATGATGTGYTLTTNLAWKTANTTTAGASSTFDGVANTAAIVTAGIADHPAAQFCKNLNIGGFTDWYLPARLELDIAYFNLKPSTGNNDTNRGSNNYSVPKRLVNYTSAYPTQTKLTAFNTSAQAFAANTHWSSEDGGVTSAWFFGFGDGSQYNSLSFGLTKAATYGVRAFRRIAL